MAKSDRHQDLPLPPRSVGQPLHRWLYTELRRAITEGRLKPGARLPSTRNLARQQSIARTTVVATYEQLQAEGYLAGRTGSGTTVAGELPDRFVRAGGKGTPAAGPVVRATKESAGAGRRLPPFAVCEPGSDVFPLRTWAQLTARRFKLGGTSLLEKGDPRGYRPLRRAVAAYVGLARSVHCDEEQVIIVNGTQQALDFTARMLVAPGEPVWIENPGYPAAADAFRQARARLVPVPVDAGGFNVRAAIKREPAPRLAYVTPAHQFPLGVTLTLDRRLQLLEQAGKEDFRIFEDDYDGEYRYDVRPLGALQGHDRRGRVIFAGSFNKVLFSSLRLGYVILPPDLVDPFLALRDAVDRYPPTIEQAVLADFFNDGHFERHVRRSRAAYLERRDALLAAARRHLAGVLDLQTTEAGLQLLGDLRTGITDTEAKARAAAHGVRVTPVSDFYLEKPVHHRLLLGFAASTPSAIAAAVERLARALRQT